MIKEMIKLLLLLLIFGEVILFCISVVQGEGEIFFICCSYRYMQRGMGSLEIVFKTRS